MGKRRGGVFLKTGMVAKKQKHDSEVSGVWWWGWGCRFDLCTFDSTVKSPCASSLLQAEPGKSDAWSKYMAEVKKYKAHQCGDDDKTRPLVK